MAGQYAKPAATGDMWLWRVDLLGNTLWARNFVVAASSSAAGVALMADHFQLFGFGRTNPTSSAALWTARADLQGNLIHSLALPQADERFGTGIAALPDGGYVFSGFHNAAWAMWHRSSQAAKIAGDSPTAPAPPVVWAPQAIARAAILASRRTAIKVAKC